MSKLCKEATLTRTQIPSKSEETPSLSEFLAQLPRETGATLQGLAFATNGTWTVLGFDKGSSAEKPKLSVTPIDEREFDPTKLFELRLWVPVKLPEEPAEGDVLAHEYRWVNGVGAVELTLTKGAAKAASEDSEPKPINGWFHKVSYLQHQSAEGSDADSSSEATSAQTGESKENATTKQMKALEFIQEEDKYGNTVVVDQLFTGEWGR